MKYRKLQLLTLLFAAACGNSTATRGEPCVLDASTSLLGAAFDEDCVTVFDFTEQPPCNQTQKEFLAALTDTKMVCTPQNGGQNILCSSIKEDPALRGCATFCTVPNSSDPRGVPLWDIKIDVNGDGGFSAKSTNDNDKAGRLQAWTCKKQ